MLDWDDPTFVIGNPQDSLWEALAVISGLPYSIAGDSVPDLIETLYNQLACWLAAEFSGDREGLATLYSDPLAICVRPQVDFSLAMWKYASHLLPRSSALQSFSGNSKLTLWLILEYSCCCSLLGRGGSTRLPDFDPATGRIAGDKAIKRNVKRAVRLHKGAIKHGPGQYDGARNPPPEKYRREYLLDAVLQHGITLSWQQKDQNLLHHCQQFLGSFEQYMLEQGPVSLFLRNGGVHVCSPRSKLPPVKGFLPPKPRGRPRKTPANC
jgi:hypothetical protein